MSTFFRTRIGKLGPQESVLQSRNLRSSLFMITGLFYFFEILPFFILKIISKIIIYGIFALLGTRVLLQLILQVSCSHKMSMQKHLSEGNSLQLALAWRTNQQRLFLGFFFHNWNGLNKHYSKHSYRKIYVPKYLWKGQQ